MRQASMIHGILTALTISLTPAVMAAESRVVTPGVTAPLTAAEIKRNYPGDALTGAAIDEPVVITSKGGMAVRVVKLAEGLSHPDGLVFLPDGETMLITERPGRLRRVHNGELDPKPIDGLPPINNVGLGGVHDIVLHPNFARNQRLYVAYTKDREPEKGTTLAILTARLVDGALIDVNDVLVTQAWESPLGTYGGRMVFGPDNLLYISVGDRDGTTSKDQSSARPQAQNLDSHIGKILRVRDDGSVPPDNPFTDDPNALDEIFSYGHRNVYGMGWHPETGDMWASEFGPAGGDEINRIIPGNNYGWPLVSMGRHYSGSLVSEQPWYREGMVNPLFFWNPAFNPSGMIFYTGSKFPRLKGSLLIAGSGSKTIAQMLMRDDFIKQGDSMGTELGVRFRDIRQGPDGYIYVLTEGRLRGPKDTDGMLLRLEPAATAFSNAVGREPLALTYADAELPNGPGKAQTVAACSRCHGLDVVFAQARSPAQWQDVIQTMIGKGMTLSDGEYGQVLSYLSTHVSSVLEK